MAEPSMTSGAKAERQRMQALVMKDAQGSLGKHTVARNTLLLSAGMAALYAMNQLTMAIATITFAAVTGLEGLAGLDRPHSLAARLSPLLRPDELWVASAGSLFSREVSVAGSWVA